MPTVYVFVMVNHLYPYYKQIGSKGVTPFFHDKSNPDVTDCSYRIENPRNQNPPSPSHIGISVEIVLCAQADRPNIKF
jgi:hypothetical protein